MIQEIVFGAILGMTLLGAFLAVWLKSVFYNALCLILCLFGVACLFIYLESEFLAVIEVILYIGAIAVAIIFAIMLSQPMFQKDQPRDAKKILRGLLISGLLGAGLWNRIRQTPWPLASPEGDYSIQAIGRSLLTVNALPFEAVSLVLLIAIVGALCISTNQKGNK